MSINVTVVGATGVSASITNTDVVNVSAGTGFQSQVPSLLVEAGANITVTTASGSFTVVGRDVPVLSVNGRTGTVVLTRTDLTAAATTHTHTVQNIVGLTNVANVASVNGITGAPSIVAGSNVTVTTAGNSITISAGATAGASGVTSINGRTGTVTLTSVDVSAASASHSHVVSDITNITSVANVVSVNGRTGVVSIAASDVTAASSTHGHNYVQAINSLTGTPSIIAGSNVTVSTSTSSIVIAAAGGIGAGDVVDGDDYDGEYLVTITITQQPANTTSAGSAATFTVAASASNGAVVSYQWQKSAAGSGVYADISGGTSAALSLTGLTNANAGESYRCVVSAGGALSVNSSAAVLSIPQNEITITQQPTDQAAVGGEATFSVAATSSVGNSLSYQWRRGVPSVSSWSSATMSVAPWVGMAYGNGLFVAVGENAIASSPTGTSWTAGTGTVPNALTGRWRDIVYGGGKFVVTANGLGAVLVSTDGTTWTPQAFGAGAPSLQGIAYGNGVFVAPASQSNVAYYSTDGIAWATATMPTASRWNDIEFANGTFVAIGINTNGSASTIAATSTNGITWTQRTLPVSANWSGITYGNGVFLAVANGTSVAATSADGITWTQRTLPSSSAWTRPMYGGGLFVVPVYASATVVTSRDGINWTTGTLPTTANWSAFAYGGGKFVLANFYAGGAVPASSPVAIGDVSQSFSNVSGATSATLSLTGLISSATGDQFQVVVSSQDAPSKTSDTATLSVPPDTVSFTTQPTNQNISSGAVTLTSLASSSAGNTVSYQWQSKLYFAGEWSNIPGATSASLALSGLDYAAQNFLYRVIAKSTSGVSLASSVAKPIAIAVTTQPSNQTASGCAATFSVTVTDYVQTRPIGFVWQQSDDNGVSWSDRTTLAGSSGATVTGSLSLSSLSDANNGLQFRAFAHNTTGTLAYSYSEAATLTVSGCGGSGGGGGRPIIV